jgi:2-hydroxychromene-2-carboxylate isomerase
LSNAPGVQPQLEFWFDFASNYSYLSVMRIEHLAAQAGVGIAWRPFLLGPIFRDFGWNTSPFLLQPEKGRYTWNDMRRRAAKYGLAFNRPSAFPRNALLPMRVALLGSSEPWIGSFCQRVMQQNFVEDVDINDPGHVRRALDGLVADPAAFMGAAQAEDIKARLREQTGQARARGVFGAPTFFVGEELFWGDDRLEDAIAFALEPAAQTTAQ